MRDPFLHIQLDIPILALDAAFSRIFNIKMIA